MAKELDMNMIPYEEAEGVAYSKEVFASIKGKKSLGKLAVIFCKIIIFSINLDDRSCIYQFFHINRNVVDMIIAGFSSNLDRDMRGLSRFKIFISGNGNG